MNQPVRISLRLLEGFHFFVLLAVTFFVSAQTPNSFDFIQMGEKNYRNGDFDKAKANFSEALHNIPKENDSLRIETLLQLGMSQYYLSELIEADSTMKVAIQLSLNRFGEEHLLTAKTQRYGGVSLAAIVKFNEALELAMKATATREKLLPENDTLLAQSYNLNSVVLRSLGRYKEAYDFTKKAEDIWLENSGVENLDKANSYYGLGWFDIAYGRTDEAIKNLQISLQLRKELLDETHLQIANCYLLLARCYRDQNKFQVSLDNAEKALEIRVARYGKHHHDVARSYMQLGDLMSELGNHVQAMEYFKTAANIWETHFGKDVLQLVRAYSSITFCHYRLNQVEEMKVALDEAQRVAKVALASDHADWIQIYSYYGKYYRLMQEPDLELEMIHRSLDIAKKKFGDRHHFYRTQLIELGNHYVQNERDEEAKKVFYEILKATEEEEGIYNDRYSLALAGLGDAFKSQGNLEKAQYLYHKALLCLSGDTTRINDLGFNPDIYSVSSKLTAINFINKKASVLKVQADRDRLNTALFYSLIDALDMGLNYADALRNVYTNDEAKIDLYRYLDQMYESLVEASVQLYEISGDALSLKKAFETSERSKGFALRQAINTNSALNYSGIPDSLVRKEKELKSKRYELSNQLVKAKIKKDEKRAASLETRNLETQRELEQLVSSLESDFPRYFELKYEKQIATLNDVKSNLGENELFVEYFLTSKQVYIFACDNQTSQVFSGIINQEFFDQIENYKKSISDYQFILDSAIRADNLYQESARFLYENLLGKVLGQFKSKSKLILVPDEEIGLVNFDALLASEVDDASVSYSGQNYLVNQFAIRTIPSATIGYQRLPAKEGRENLLSYAGFAPTYSGYENEPATSFIRNIFQSNIPELTGNRGEVQTVSSVLRGQVFLDEQATESKFKEISGAYKYLHLAMHGFVNEKDGDGRLVFAKSEGESEDDQLFIPEIYNLDLNADLVVLSACNSGSGRLQKGEGIMSMARSFLYAGSPSVIMSQWTLPDAIAPILISDFSKNLLSGAPKDDALRAAKLNYLKTVKDPNLAHPYYWAGLVAIGDMSPVEFNSANKVLSVLISVLLGAAVLLLIIFVMKRFSPSQSTP